MISEQDFFALLLSRGLGPKKIGRILEHLDSSSQAVDFSSMSTAQVSEACGISREFGERVRSSLHSAAEMLSALQKNDVNVLIKGGEGYPSPLVKTLGNEAPLVLYVKGNCDILKMKGVGFCGARNASPAGLDIAHEFAGILSKLGINIISGYAHGIDMSTHRAALELGGNTTLVLAEGIFNFKLKNDLLPLATSENYVVISEFAPRLPWIARNAMQRNATICGLASAVIVVESGPQGGTFEAGKAALRMNRPLYVIEREAGVEPSEGEAFLLASGANHLGRANGPASLQHLADALNTKEPDITNILHQKNTGDEQRKIQMSLPGMK